MATLCDSYSETNREGNFGVGQGDSLSRGQSFTGNGGILNTAIFELYKNEGASGNCYAKIYTHSGTFGTSSVPTSTALATSVAIDASVLSAGLNTFTFSGANKITLSNGTKYCVAFEYQGTPTVGVGEDNTSPTHDGNGFYTTDLITWGAYADTDFIFYVYTDAASISASPSLSPSLSLSLSPSLSRSLSLSLSPSLSISLSISLSPSLSPSPSASISLSPSLSPSPSSSISLSPSLSFSASVSLSPSLSPSPSASISLSPSTSPSPSIGYFNYRIRDCVVPRPDSLKREFIFVKSDMTSLNGKISRDTILLKEKYLISWDMIDVTTASELLTVINRNEVVEFEVDDGVLQIPATLVHVYIASQGYEVLGSNYLSALVLELIEEE